MPGPGRPRTNAAGSSEAGARLADRIRRRNLTQASVAKHMNVSQRTVGRWVGGETGPDLATARRLAEFFDDPEVVSWWWHDLSADPVEREADPDRAPWSPKVLIGAVVVLILALIVVAVTTLHSSPTAASTAPSGPVPAVVGTGAAARLTAPVDGAMTSGHPSARTITLWSRPSTSSGCDISACQPGTDQVGTLTLPATVVVMCSTVGQQIRNGEPGESGFYRDDRWLKLEPGQAFGQTSKDQVLWLSNIWFLRDRLPGQLPQC